MARARVRRRVLLRLVVQLDDLGARRYAAASTRAHHEHGADREVRREEDGQAAFAPARRRRASRPGCADHARHAGVERAQDVVDTTSGAVKSTRIGGRVDELVPGRFERRREHAPDLSAPSVQADLHAAAAARTSPGLIPLTAAVNVRSSGPMPEAERRSG